MCRYVTIGIPKLPDLPQITTQDDNVSEVIDYRIQAPRTNIEPYTNTNKDKTANRLTQIFLNVIYTVIYRIRAEKRIRMLKAGRKVSIKGDAQIVDIFQSPLVDKDIIKPQ